MGRLCDPEKRGTEVVEDDIEFLFDNVNTNVRIEHVFDQKVSLLS